MNATEYVNSVISKISADERTLSRLRSDLSAHIEEAAQTAPIDEVIKRMGSPSEMAKDLTEAIYRDSGSILGELVKTKSEVKNPNFYEYKSKTHIFGLPLVHIKTSSYGRFGRAGIPLCMAKGIIAIGDAALGVVAIGGLALGVFSIGGLALGLLCFGGIGLGILLGMGGVATGLMAFGGLAVGFYAMGGCAIASHIAVGGYASANVAIGGAAKGAYTLITGGPSLNTLIVTKETAQDLILQGYPNISDFLLNLMTLFFL